MTADFVAAVLYAGAVAGANLLVRYQWRRMGSARASFKAATASNGHPYRAPGAPHDATAAPVPAAAAPERPATRLYQGPQVKCPKCGAQNAARCTNCKQEAALGLLDPPGICLLHKIIEEDGTKWTSSKPRVRVARVTAPVYCSPAKRHRVGQWGPFFGRCEEPGEHLHQQCLVCGAAWICAPAEAVPSSASST